MSYNLVGRYHGAFDPLFDTFQMMVWHKSNPIPNFFKAGFLNSCELLAACWDKGHSWNFKSQKEMHNFYEGPVCSGKQRIKGADGAVLHPTQKPLHILTHIVEIASKPGDLVFDPFMGVASTGAACQNLGRRFLGAEIDPTYYAAGCKRLGIPEAPIRKGKTALAKSLAAVLGN